MILTGQFNDIDDNLVTVQISKSDGVNSTVTIGENGLFFHFYALLALGVPG